MYQVIVEQVSSKRSKLAYAHQTAHTLSLIRLFNECFMGIEWSIVSLGRILSLC